MLFFLGSTGSFSPHLPSSRASSTLSTGSRSTLFSSSSSFCGCLCLLSGKDITAFFSLWCPRGEIIVPLSVYRIKLTSFAEVPRSSSDLSWSPLSADISSSRAQPPLVCAPRLAVSISPTKCQDSMVKWVRQNTLVCSRAEAFSCFVHMNLSSNDAGTRMSLQ